MSHNASFVSIDFRTTCSSSDDPEDRFVTRFKGTIYTFDENVERCLVGFCKASQVRLGDGLDNGFSHFDLFDLDGSFASIGDTLLENASEFSSELYERYRNQLTYVSDILFVEALEILPEHRGRGYGLQAIEVILSHLRPGLDSIAALKAHPMQYEEDESLVDLPEERRSALGNFGCSFDEGLQKLVEHYSKAGFELFNSDRIMVRPLGF